LNTIFLTSISYLNYEYTAKYKHSTPEKTFSAFSIWSGEKRKRGGTAKRGYFLSEKQFSAYVKKA
jgi:hypothetical protein